jgi:hypothetical protein
MWRKGKLKTIDEKAKENRVDGIHKSLKNSFLREVV